MSYCRFSSDNWRSDIYVYEDVNGGWTTHVAGNRFVGNIPEEPDFIGLDPNDEGAVRKALNQHKAVMDFIQSAERQPIDHPLAGQSFNDPTPAACADRLESLRAAGFHIPQHAIDDLRSEAAEANKED